MVKRRRSARILLPVRRWFIYLTLFVALLFNFMPTGGLPFVPDSVVLVLIFWGIREPAHVGMTTGFLLGILVDIGQGAAMGQHALAYVILMYLAGTLSRRLLWFPLSQQALHVLPLLLLGQAIMVAVRLIGGAEFPGWWYFLSSFVGVLLWLPLSVLLLLPQYQPVGRDENRPL